MVKNKFHKKERETQECKNISRSVSGSWLRGQRAGSVSLVKEWVTCLSSPRRRCLRHQRGNVISTAALAGSIITERVERVKGHPIDLIVPSVSFLETPNCAAHTGNTRSCCYSPHTYKMTPVTRNRIRVRMWWTGSGWLLTSYEETEVFPPPVSRFSQAEADSQRAPAHRVLAPRGSLVPGDGVLGWGEGLAGRLKVGRNIQAHVKRLTAAWTWMEADPAEPGRSRPPSPGRALPGCGGANTACPEVAERCISSVSPETHYEECNYANIPAHLHVAVSDHADLWDEALADYHNGFSKHIMFN